MQQAETATARNVRLRAQTKAPTPANGGPRILMTGVHTFFGARMLQALGAAGCEITAADPVRWSSGKASRYTSRPLRTPPLRESPGALLDMLVDEVRSNQYDLVLPTFEEAILLADHRDRFAPHVSAFLPAPDVAWNLHHKGRLHLFCRDVGIPTPATLLADDEREWSAVAGSLGFPAFVKPSVGLGSIARSRCPDHRSVIEGFRQVAATGLGVDPLLQRAIDGEVVSGLLFCHEGRILGEVLYRSLRTFPDDCGTSAHRESVCHPGVSRTAQRLVEAANWSGFLGFDMVVESTTGRTYLIDVNPRATPGLQLGLVAGVDWARIVLDLLDGRPAMRTIAGRAGVRARSVLFDTAWLLEGFRPQRGWLRRGFDRLRAYLRPGWTLDSEIDLADGDRRAVLAMVAYTLSCVATGFTRSGQSMGDLLFRESTYDRRTAEPIATQVVPRGLAGDAHAPHSMPGRNRVLRRSG